MHKRALFFFSLLASAGKLWAGETPLYAPAPDWVTPAPAIVVKELPANAPALLVLDQQVHLSDGRRWVYLDNAMRASSAEVLGQIGTISLPWHPAKGDLIVHRAEIIRETETIDLLATGSKFSILQREQQLEQRQMTGLLSATLAAGGLRIGDVLRVSFSVTQEDPALGGRVDGGSLLPAAPVRAHFGRFRLVWPTDTKINWKVHGETPEVVPVKRGNLQELVIPLPLDKQTEMPADSPVRYRRLPLLEASSFTGWDAVSKAAAALYGTEGTIAADGPLRAEVDRIKAAESDPRKRMALALRLVQDQVRYLFQGMADGNYVPQAPERTWEARYGDCKAKTLLLLAMLDALEIEAEPVLAHLQMGDWLPERLPSFAAFDHILVRATLDGRTYWLDGTASGTREADLEDTPPFHHVLPVRAGGADLIAISTRPSKRPDIKAEIELDQSAGISFPPPYRLSMTLRGQLAEMLRLASAQAGEEQIKAVVTGLAGAYVNNGSVVTHKISFDEDAGTATVDAAGLANVQWRKKDDRYRTLLDRTIDSISFAPDRSRAAWQQLPVMTDYPSHQQLTMRLRLPDGGKGFSFDGRQALSETVAGLELRRTASLENDLVTIEETVAARDAEIPADQIAGTRERLAAVRAQLLHVAAPSSHPPRWQQVISARAEKRFDPILALYQKDIDREPTEAAHYYNRAVFYDGVYDYRRAISDLDELLKLQADAATYLWRARLYMKFGEKDRAFADAEAARKLDPGSDDALLMIAKLYSDRGDYETGREMLDDRIAEGGPHKATFQMAKAVVLGDQGKIDEALGTYDDAIAASPGNPALLAGRCSTKGTRNVAIDTALKDCTKAIELAENPADSLAGRAMVYFRMGRLDEAMADLDAAAAIDPNLYQVLYLRGVLRNRNGDKAGGASDLAGARLLWPAVDTSYAKFGVTP